MRYRRTIIPGATYFFTLNLAQRKSTLLTDEINKLRLSFLKVKEAHSFEIDAIVILPDHLHMVMTLPKGDANYSQRWNLIKGTFSRQIVLNEQIPYARKKKRERGIWQRRFWEHMIREEKDYEHHINYIHYNPVKHRYVQNPTDWQFSSIHTYIAQDILPADWATEIKLIDGGFGE